MQRTGTDGTGRIAVIAWRVLRSAKKRPTAHIVSDTTKRTRDNSLIADCGAKGGLVNVDGEPVAPACPRCMGAA